MDAPVVCRVLLIVAPDWPINEPTALAETRRVKVTLPSSVPSSALPSAGFLEDIVSTILRRAVVIAGIVPLSETTRLSALGTACSILMLAPLYKE